VPQFNIPIRSTVGIKLFKPLLIITLLAAVGAQANTITATASAGFQSAQITDSKTAGCYYDSCSTYPYPYLPPPAPITPQGVTASKSFAFRGQNASASARVATPALLTASAAVSSTSIPFDRLNASSSANFQDQITFSAAGYAGQTALIFIHYEISGISSTSLANTNAQSSLNLYLGSNYFYESAYTSYGFKSGYFDPNYKYTGYKVMSTELGKLTNISATLNTSCTGLSFDSGFNCEATSTFKFLGIAGAALLDGTELGNLTVTSQSKFDYINGVSPVPEPSTYAMMSLGVLCLAIGASRARRR